MLMITSSPAPDFVTSVLRLSCHRPFRPVFWRTLVHAVLNDVLGRVGSLGRGVPKTSTNHSGRRSPKRLVYHEEAWAVIRQRSVLQVGKPCGRDPREAARKETQRELRPFGTGHFRICVMT